MGELKNYVILRVTRGNETREVNWNLDALHDNQRVQIEKDENGEFQFYVVTLNDKEVGHE